MRDISPSLIVLLIGLIWNSLHAAVVLSSSVALFKRNLAKLTLGSFFNYS